MNKNNLLDCYVSACFVGLILGLTAMALMAAA